MKAVGGDHEASLGKNLLCGIQSRPLNYTVQIYQIKLHVRQAEHKTLINKSPMIWIRLQMLLQFQPGTLREQPFNSNEIQKIRHY